MDEKRSFGKRSAMTTRKKVMLILVFMLIVGKVVIFAQNQVSEEFIGTWISGDGKNEGRCIITATNISVTNRGVFSRQWSAEIISWREIPNEGKHKQEYPTIADITLKANNQTGSLQLFIHRNRSQFVMKAWLGTNWNYPLIKQ